MQDDRLPAGGGFPGSPGALVLDTNVALDLLVFRDPRAVPVRESLAAGTLAWLATAAMREEFARVLGYRRVQAWLQREGRAPSDLVDAFDAACRLVEVPPVTEVRCADPDDQIFIDLAVAHRALLLSKDAEVLRLKARLGKLDVMVFSSFPLWGKAGMGAAPRTSAAPGRAPCAPPPQPYPGGGGG